MVDDIGPKRDPGTLEIKFKTLQIRAVNTPRAIAVDPGSFNGPQIHKLVRAAIGRDANGPILIGFDEDVIGLFFKSNRLGRRQGAN